MSKFKNKKALALSVGAIMAGVSVIGVVAACAPTKAKPNKPSQGTQNPSQSTNPGSGSTTNPSGQGSNNGGTTNPSGGSNNNTPETTQHSTPQASPNTGETPNVTQPPKQGESGATPDNTTKNEQGDQGSNNVDSEAEKKKKEQEEQAAKQKEAEDALKAKKEQANTTISGLTNLSDEERNGYKDRVEKITDTNKITEIEDIVKEAQAKDDEKKKAKEAADKLEEAKQKAINEIKNLQALEENERTTFVQKIEAIKTVEQKDEVEKILKEAKDANTKKLQEEAKKQADEIKQDQITSAKLTIANDKYFWLELIASKETYDKLKDKRLMFNLDKIGGNEGVEFATRFKVGENAFTFHKFIKNEGSNVIFQISSDQAYGAENEKGKYRVTKIWLENDVTETNLLKTPSNEVDNV